MEADVSECSGFPVCWRAVGLGRWGVERVEVMRANLGLWLLVLKSKLYDFLELILRAEEFI